MLDEFKKFAMRGNVVDMAVGIIIGASFGKIVDSLVKDIIMPVEDAYQRWGDRASILGGVDMDILARGGEEQVRARTRAILDACGANGTGYCLGSGNTIATYVPLANYLAMLDEGRCWNREHFGML